MRTPRLALLVTSVVVTLLALPDRGAAIARYPDEDQDLPESIINATVRVTGFIAGSRGTGTVIRVKPDAEGPGGWLCVLTADHFMSDPGGLEVTVRNIGFGNGTVEGSWEYPAQIYIPGPVIRRLHKNVDLAVLGIRVEDLSRLPNLDPLPEPAEPILGSPGPILVPGLILAGYGHWGDVDTPNQYNIQGDNASGDYGTLRSGVNTIDDLPTNFPSPSNPKYAFDALIGDLDFLRDGDWPPRRGEAHPLKGDSGGPSYQFDLRPPNGAWLLVGVHHGGETDGPAGPGYTRVLEGRTWRDVRVGSYLDWIKRSCDRVPSPDFFDLAITQTAAPDPVRAGQELTYTLTVTHNRGRRARGVTVVDTLPAGADFVSKAASQGTCAQAGVTVSCNLGALRRGARATITIVVKPNATGTITNTAAVAADGQDTNADNNAATIQTTVSP
jgi:uncharacterized repeat protein (TIGR01451 family)